MGILLLFAVKVVELRHVGKSIPVRNLSVRSIRSDPPVRVGEKRGIAGGAFRITAEDRKLIGPIGGGSNLIKWKRKVSTDSGLSIVDCGIGDCGYVSLCGQPLD